MGCNGPGGCVGLSNKGLGELSDGLPGRNAEGMGRAGG